MSNTSGIVRNLCLAQMTRGHHCSNICLVHLPLIARPFITDLSSSFKPVVLILQVQVLYRRCSNFGPFGLCCHGRARCEPSKSSFGIGRTFCMRSSPNGLQVVAIGS